MAVLISLHIKAIWASVMYLNICCLSSVFIATKRHYDYSNSQEGKRLIGGFLQFIIMVKSMMAGRQDAGEGAESSRFVGRVSHWPWLELLKPQSPAIPTPTSPNLSRVQLPMGQKVDSSQEAKSHTKSEIVMSWFLWIQTVCTGKMSCFLVLHSRCKLYWGAGGTFCSINPVSHVITYLLICV